MARQQQSRLACAAVAAALLLGEQAAAFAPANLHSRQLFASQRNGAVTKRQVLAEPVVVDKTASSRPVLDLDALRNVQLSGLNGQALVDKEFPTKNEVLSAIPAECFELDTKRSLQCTAWSLVLTAACAAAGAALIPVTPAALPAWVAYAAVTGTVAMGNWVIAHECGHGAFSSNRALQDFVGFTLHSALLVPYYSWQRSHAVHHAHTNHVTHGETHVPETAHRAGEGGLGSLAIRNRVEGLLGKPVGRALYGAVQLINHLLIGWPAYLLVGATGGPSRGVTNHFVPTSDSLFPGAWKKKVWTSTAGVAVTAAALAAWAAHSGVATVAALYGGPYLVVNAWLVVYTWLQHTNSDVPHFASDNFSFIKGAMHSIDRPYGRVIDFLHHRIGSTHVAHHIESKIPHYRAKEATEALRAAFPEHYLYDPTPVPVALWRVAKYCTAVEKRGDKYVFVQEPSA
ncbi:fatty acid desaturase [Tribonema minus]|uniref:Fatty acid desaturase n=1 Tax=Tribonema minus TaxID=303371 RepID=A0A835YKJ6_9STRA|nr:fatty acid desaturase [Tribonema minus]